MAAAKSAVVIGGGFVGLSCALHLQRIGRRVVLVDRGSVGGAQSASYGNAGTMACYANVPTNSPSLFRKLPGMLLDPSSPLSVRVTPHLVVSMLPWAALFAWHCRPSAVEHTADALGALLARAEAGYEPVWKQAGIDVDGPMGEHASGDEFARSRPYAVRNGYLLLQRTEEMMRASEAGAALRRRGLGDGLKMEALTADEVLALEPALSDRVVAGGAWYFSDGWFLSEPAALLRALVAGFETGGGVFREGEATHLRADATAGAAVRLDDGSELVADDVVVAAGAHSKALAASIGDWVPLDTERGYHVAFARGTESLLTRAVCDPTEGFIASPMAGGLRVAGKVELGGLRAPADASRYAEIERATCAMIPGIGARCEEEDWLGFRPTMPDALPVIGRSGRVPAVVYAFGHQHVGWTLGGVTGQLVAEIVEGRAPSVDIEPYRAGRFGWG